MRGHMTTTRTLLAVLAALLLATPQAGALKGKKRPAGRSKAAAKADPGAERLMGEGLGNLQRGEYTAAISAFTKAVSKQGSVSSYFLLGWAHYQRGFRMGSVE